MKTILLVLYKATASLAAFKIDDEKHLSFDGKNFYLEKEDLRYKFGIEKSVNFADPLEKVYNLSGFDGDFFLDNPLLDTFLVSASNLFNNKVANITFEPFKDEDKVGSIKLDNKCLECSFDILVSDPKNCSFRACNDDKKSQVFEVEIVPESNSLSANSSMARGVARSSRSARSSSSAGYYSRGSQMRSSSAGYAARRSSSASRSSSSSRSAMSRSSMSRSSSSSSRSFSASRSSSANRFSSRGF